MNIQHYTETEINNLIFGNAHPGKHCSMSVGLAKQIIQMEHLSQSLQDWAWLVIAEHLDKEV